MRFTGWLWVVYLAWIGMAWGQAPLPPGYVLLPKSARMGVDPPIVVLQEYAKDYQALQAGRLPPPGSVAFMLAQMTFHDCATLQEMTALTEFGNSFQRLLGSVDSMRVSDREIIFTSVARYACADSENGAQGARVPAYEVMSHMKGTFAETIAPRVRTILPGMSQQQAASFQQFGDATQRFRTDPTAPPVPGTIAGRMADFQELMKLPPEERKKAMDELNARYAKEKLDKTEQARNNAAAAHIVAALSAKGAAAPKALAFLQLLQPGEAYVDLYKYYAREGDGFGALNYLAVVSDSRSSRLVRLGPAESIDTVVAKYVANSQDKKDFDSSWQDLQRLLVQPLLAALPTGSKMIWLSPDSDLFGLPFASLMLDLRAELSVTIVPSAYDFSRVAAAAAGSSPTGKVLLVGDMVEGPATASATQAVALADVSPEFDGQKLQVQKLSGHDATLPNVITSMKDAQYILFSTHGRWENSLGTTPAEAFRSAGIELWSGGVTSADSVLTAADVIKNDLSQSDLVVLLACETAKGQTVNGEGSLGFQSAFMVAGARSLLVAVWRVPAEPSKELVRNFYAGLFKLHLSKADALKYAQNALRSQPQFADPWNWAGWVLLGDPRPVAR